MTEVLFVAVLVQRQLGTRVVPIDETGVGQEPGESRFAGSIGCKPRENRGQLRPRTSAFGIRGVVSVPGAIRHPPELPQFVMATDIRKPPGVIMCRNGAAAATSRTACTSQTSSRSASPRSSTAPSADRAAAQGRS